MNAPAAQSKDGTKLFNDVKSTVAAVESGDWVSAGLGMANTAMDIIGSSGNPLSGFLSAGFSWAIQHVDFLKEPFDALLGDPQAITKMADSWKSAGTQVASIAADYKRTSVEQTRTWMGKSADAYRTASANHSTGLETLSKAAAGISSAVKGAGELVAMVRKTIMDLISQAVSDMVMKIIQWLAASFFTFGAAIGAAIADIVTMACNYAKKLADFLSKLASSLKKLIDLIKQVSNIAQIAKQVVQAISAMSHKGASGGGGGGPANTRPSAGGLGLTQEQIDEVRRRAEGQYATPGGYTAPSGSSGGAGSAGGQVSAPPPIPGSTGPNGETRGHWEPGKWVDDTAASTARRPPTIPGTGGGSYPAYRPDVPAASHPVTPVRTLPGNFTVPDHTTMATGAHGGGGGGGGGIPGGGGSGGGFSGGSAGSLGGAGGGAGNTLQAGGASGVLPGGAHGGGAGGGAGGGGGGMRPGGGGGGAGGGAMGGGMMGGGGGAGGQGGGEKDHQRKVRIEGEDLIEPPKASKPVIGE
jgi:uncharacterized protein YukE